MKKALLIGLAFLFVSSAVSAQQLAMFTDVNRTSWCAEGVTVGQFVTVYLFANPGPEGMQCIELSTTHEGGLYMPFAPTWAPNTLPPQMGSFPDANMAACFDQCFLEGDWAWACNAMLYMQSTDPVTISIHGFVGGLSPYPLHLTCAGDEIEAFAYNNFYINSCGPVSVEESSWGAIKSLYE